MNVGNDFAFFGVGVCSESERWVVSWSFDGGDDRFGSGCVRGSGDGTFNEGDLRVGNLEVVDSGVGLEFRGRHVVVVWSCCWRCDLREWMETLRFFCPLLSCLEGNIGFFR